MIETASVRKSVKGKSNESNIQAKELEELFLKDDVKVKLFVKDLCQFSIPNALKLSA